MWRAVRRNSPESDIWETVEWESWTVTERERAIRRRDSTSRRVCGFIRWGRIGACVCEEQGSGKKPRTGRNAAQKSARGGEAG